MLETAAIRTIPLPSGEPIPVLGQGTARLGQERALRRNEIAALQLGLDLGLRLIDTAEAHGDGSAEELVGEAIESRRDEVFLVGKVVPTSRHGTIEACERSLKRLRTDRFDLYLMRWRAQLPLGPMIEALTELLESGKIRHWGVSDFDVIDLAEVMTFAGDAVETDEVVYNLAHRGIELDLLPWCRERGIPVLAYAPTDRGRLLDDVAVRAVAARHGATPAQVAVAWVLAQEAVCAIVEAGTAEQVREIRAALELELTKEDLATLDQEFPPPTGPEPLEIL